MRVNMAIIGIIILIIGVGILAGGRWGEESNSGLKMMEDALKDVGATEITCTGFYGATLRQNSIPNEKIESAFQEAGFELLSISKGDKMDKIKGRLPSGITGVLFLYRTDGRPPGVSFTVSGPETNEVCEAILRVSQGLAGYTAGEINTFTLKGSVYRKLDQTAMASITERIMGMMRTEVAEKSSDQNSLNVLGVSPYLPPGKELNGEKINLNLVIKPHNQEDKTIIYAGTPYLSTPY